MPARDALAAIHGARGERDIVVTTMTPARDWMTFTQHPLDVVMVPSAMGHATSIGLGLALAQPTRRVIVCNGDGSMLMNLGSLVSIADAKATNVVVAMFENGVYEVTGEEPSPAPAPSTSSRSRRRRGSVRRSSFLTWRPGNRRRVKYSPPRGRRSSRFTSRRSPERPLPSRRARHLNVAADSWTRCGPEKAPFVVHKRAVSVLCLFHP